jgi:hypothetical protein
MSLQLGIGMAAAPAIGTVIASGSFRLDHLNVTGNATLFEGSLVETAASASAVALSSGARLSLEAASRGKLFGDRLVLEKGETRLDNGTGFHLEALGLRVQPERGATTGRVSLEGSRRVRVAALTGSFRILNAQGQLVANLPAGATLAFEPQSGTSTATRVTGIVENHSGHFLMTDEVTNVTVEVVGVNLAEEAGQRVEITGTLDAGATPYAGASQVVRVSQKRRLGGGARTAAAGQGVKSSMAKATAATIAIVGGVAAAAVVGGLAASGSLPGQGGGVSR